MKKYYQTLNKEKKKEIKEKFKQEYKNTELKYRLNRLMIYSLLGYAVSIFIIVYAILKEENDIGSIIIGTTLFIASTIFLIGRFLIKRNVLNKFALKNK